MKKTYIELPEKYSVCEHSDCPVAATCLHQLAYTRLIETEKILHLINPNQCSKNDTCEYYRSNTPVVYARGFRNFKEKMLPAQYDRFSRILIGEYGRNPYYERRRGDYPLPPSEQQFILQALKLSGVTEDFRFDSYEELINWYD